MHLMGTDDPNVDYWYQRYRELKKENKQLKKEIKALTGVIVTMKEKEDLHPRE